MSFLRDGLLLGRSERISERLVVRVVDYTRSLPFLLSRRWGTQTFFSVLVLQRRKRCPRSSCTISLACRCGHERRHRSAGERLCRIHYVLAVICEGAVTLGVPKQTLPAVACGHFSRGRDSRSSSPSGNSRNVEDVPALTTCSPCTVLRFSFFSPRASSRSRDCQSGHRLPAEPVQRRTAHC